VGRYEEAIAAQKQALLRNPNWLFSSELVGNYLSLWALQRVQDPQILDRAFEAAHRAVVLQAASPWSRRALSAAYLWKKQYGQASVEAEQVLNLNPSFGVIYVGLANTLSFLGRSEEASGLVEKALRLNPRLPTESFFPLGHTYYLTGRTEEAIAALKKSLNGSPADLGAHLYLYAEHTKFWLLGATGSLLPVLFARTGGQATSGTQIDSRAREPESWCNLYIAAVYSELGRDADAQAEAAEVLRINPNWSLEVWKQRAPYKDPAMLERVFAALQKAGLK
jgi:tetratricopeptide (TPR) repeat protein